MQVTGRSAASAASVHACAGMRIRRWLRRTAEWPGAHGRPWMPPAIGGAGADAFAWKYMQPSRFRRWFRSASGTAPALAGNGTGAGTFAPGPSRPIRLRGVQEHIENDFPGSTIILSSNQKVGGRRLGANPGFELCQLLLGYLLAESVASKALPGSGLLHVRHPMVQSRRILLPCGVSLPRYRVGGPGRAWGRFRVPPGRAERRGRPVSRGPGCRIESHDRRSRTCGRRPRRRSRPGRCTDRTSASRRARSGSGRAVSKGLSS